MSDSTSKPPLSPMPGGDIVDMPQNRMTLPGGAPGGGGNAPTAAPGGPPAGGVGDMPSPMSFDGSRRTLMQEHTRNKALVDATGKSLRQLDVIRKGLTHLAEKQDIVTLDDIVTEAGKLVAHGIDPVALAGILADAPQEGGGEALAAWVAGHAQTAAQAEAQLKMQYNLASHNMGMSAIHLLMAHENARNMMGGMMPPMGEEQGTNQLQPGETDSDPANPANPMTRMQ